MHLIFLDTETTDLDNARLVQLAYKNLLTGVVVNELFKPAVPITYGAMAVHHITNEMVVEKPVFQESNHFNLLNESLANGVIVAHNAPFDLQVLKNEGISVPVYIDTLRVARHVLKSPQHALQYLRYALGLNVTAVAHDALGDIIVLEALYGHLKKIVIEKFSLSTDDEIIQKMIAFSQAPVLLTALTFGKYRGKTYEELAALDRGYLEWLFNSETQKAAVDQNKELVFTLKHYLKVPDISDLPF